MTPRQRRFATTDDIEIAAWDWGGDGPIALLHHANGMCGATWTLVAERLASRYRVVAVDARGHGDSSSPPAPEGSFGGIVTAMAEARRPALFERIAMLDPPIHPDAALSAQLDASGGILDPRPSIAAQARKRNAVWPSR